MEFSDILQEIPLGKEVLQTAPETFAMENPQEAPTEEVVQQTSDTSSEMPREAYDNPQEDEEERQAATEGFSEEIESIAEDKLEEEPDEEAHSKEKKNDDVIQRWMRLAVVAVCIVDLTYIVATAVLIGMLKGWGYSVHCFLLCLLILASFVLTIKAKTKLFIKKICVGSCTTLVFVLMTTFTLLTRQAYYHPSSHIPPKWVLFCLQASIIPLVVGVLAMYECNIRDISKDRFILMITILDFADIWDMASVLEQHRAPYIKEEAPLEIAIQFFCSFSFIIFSVLISKNILQLLQHPTFKTRKVDLLNLPETFCSQVALSSSQLFQNIPFMIIRILIIQNHGYIDFDYLAKNVISVVMWALDCFQGFRDLRAKQKNA